MHSTRGLTAASGVRLAPQAVLENTCYRRTKDSIITATESNRAIKKCIAVSRGVYRGDVDAGLAQGGKNSTLKGGRIPPDVWVIRLIIDDCIVSSCP